MIGHFSSNSNDHLKFLDWSDWRYILKRWTSPDAHRWRFRLVSVAFCWLTYDCLQMDERQDATACLVFGSNQTSPDVNTWQIICLDWWKRHFWFENILLTSPDIKFGYFVIEHVETWLLQRRFGLVLTLVQDKSDQSGHANMTFYMVQTSPDFQTKDVGLDRMSVMTFLD